MHLGVSLPALMGLMDRAARLLRRQRIRIRRLRRRPAVGRMRRGRPGLRLHRMRGICVLVRLHEWLPVYGIGRPRRNRPTGVSCT
jgi:hypothetical protein